MRKEAAAALLVSFIDFCPLGRASTLPVWNEPGHGEIEQPWARPIEGRTDSRVVEGVTRYPSLSQVAPCRNHPCCGVRVSPGHPVLDRLRGHRQRGSG